MRFVLALILALPILAAPAPLRPRHPPYDERTLETAPTVGSEPQDTFNAEQHGGQDVAGSVIGIPNPGTEVDLNLEDKTHHEERDLEFRAVRGGKAWPVWPGRYRLGSGSDKRDVDDAADLDDRAVRGAKMTSPQRGSRYSFSSSSGDKRDGEEADDEDGELGERAVRGGAGMTSPHAASRYSFSSHDKREALQFDESEIDERAVRGGLKTPHSASRYSFSSHDKREALDGAEMDERAMRGGAAMRRPQSPTRYSFTSHDKREDHSADSALQPEERAVRGGYRLSSPNSGSRYHLGSTDKRDEGELEEHPKQDATPDSPPAGVDCPAGSSGDKRGLVSSPLGVETVEAHDRRPVV